MTYEDRSCGGFYCMTCAAAPFDSVETLIAHKRVVHGATMPGFPHHQSDSSTEREPCPRCGRPYVNAYLPRHLRVCPARARRTG